jgi:hypothetical protein
MTQSAAESLLLPLDPVRGLHTITAEVGRLADLDPKIREAGRLLEERMGVVPSGEDRDNVLMPILWMHLRSFVANPGTYDAVRERLADGDAVLRQVESSLETTFSEEALTAAVGEAKAASEQESANKSAVAARLEMAKQELASMETLETVPGFAAAIAIAIVVAGVIVGFVYVVEAVMEALS